MDKRLGAREVHGPELVWRWHCPVKEGNSVGVAAVRVVVGVTVGGLEVGATRGGEASGKGMALCGRGAAVKTLVRADEVGQCVV